MTLTDIIRKLSKGISTTLLVGGLYFSPSLDSNLTKAYAQDLIQTKIAFSSRRDGSYGIYTMNPDGTDVRQITNHPAQEQYPSWSPDGKRIAFMSDIDKKSADIYGIFTVNADGTDVRKITDDSTNDRFPRWSPDGKRIAFMSYRFGQSITYDIYTMNPDGTDVRQITNHPSNDLHPTWSPYIKPTDVSPQGKTPTLWAELKRAYRF